MNPLDLIIDNKKYEYVNNICLNDINYIAFKDQNYLYIKEYKIIENKLKIIDIDDITYVKIRKLMNL